MSSIAAQPTGGSREAFFAGYRLFWWAGLALILVINFHTSPLSEWIDRDKAVAAARIGLKVSPYPSTSPDSEPVQGFGAAGRAIGVRGWEQLVAVDGRAVPEDRAERVAMMSGPTARR